MRKEFTKELIAMLEGASIDDSENRLFVLDPSAFTLLNGVDSETRLALHAAFGLTADASAAIDGWTPSPMSVAIRILMHLLSREYAAAPTGCGIRHRLHRLEAGVRHQQRLIGPRLA